MRLTNCPDEEGIVTFSPESAEQLADTLLLTNCPDEKGIVTNRSFVASLLCTASPGLRLANRPDEEGMDRDC